MLNARMLFITTSIIFENKISKNRRHHSCTFPISFISSITLSNTEKKFYSCFFSFCTWNFLHYALQTLFKVFSKILRTSSSFVLLLLIFLFRGRPLCNLVWVSKNQRKKNTYSFFILHKNVEKKVVLKANILATKQMYEKRTFRKNPNPYKSLWEKCLPVIFFVLQVIS